MNISGTPVGSGFSILRAYYEDTPGASITVSATSSGRRVTLSLTRPTASPGSANGPIVGREGEHRNALPAQLRPGTVHLPELAELAELAEELAALRVHPHELDGDLLRLFVPKAPEIDQHKDKRLGSVAKIIAECASVQAAATHLMARQPDWDPAAVYFDGIDHFGHGFLRYHPPRLGWVDKADYALYNNVVNAGYLFHDMLLGRLLELAGPEATVMLVSDHGFHPDHLRPKALPNEPAGPAAEHRAFGIFAACGPGIRRDALVYGANLLDVTPTALALALFGLPIGRDMDGRVLTDDHRPADQGNAPGYFEHQAKAFRDPSVAESRSREVVILGGHATAVKSVAPRPRAYIVRWRTL